MPITITIKDETAGGRIFNETPISFDSELTTVRDIITARVDNIFLPFEGDSLLSLILSKAVLLADEDKITDSAILRQIDY